MSLMTFIALPMLVAWKPTLVYFSSNSCNDKSLLKSGPSTVTAVSGIETERTSTASVTAAGAAPDLALACEGSMEEDIIQMSKGIWGRDKF